jgi:hypothetical protein
MLHPKRATRPLPLRGNRALVAFKFRCVLRGDISIGATSGQPARGGAQSGEGSDSEWEGLTPDEDYEVPGNAMSVLSQNTELGRAVSAACDEMHHLGGLEADVLRQAEDLLRKHGGQGNLSAVPPDKHNTPDEDKQSSF